MTNQEIKIGGVYVAKVSGRLANVRIDGTSPYGGWNATSTSTGQRVRIKSAQRLRSVAGEVSTAPKADPGEPGAKTGKSKVKPGAKAKPDVARPTDAAQRKGKAKAAKPDKPKRLSCLDAAAQVLRQAKQPLRCQQMVEAMAKAGLWKSAAPTPAATLYSAILREMQKQGHQARFKKIDRGQFALTGKGREP